MKGITCIVFDSPINENLNNVIKSYDNISPKVLQIKLTTQLNKLNNANKIQQELERLNNDSKYAKQVLDNIIKESNKEVKLDKNTEIYNRLVNETTEENNNQQQEQLKEEQKALNTIVENRIKELGIRIQISNEKQRNEQNPYYDTATKTITLPKDYTAVDKLHEMIHGVTLYYLDHSDKASLPDVVQKGISELTTAYETLKEISTKEEKDQFQGLDSVEEFTAELANPNFIDFIKKKDNDKSLKDKIQNLFQKLINALKKILQLEEPTYSGIHDMAINGLNNLLDNPNRTILDNYSLNKKQTKKRSAKAPTLPEVINRKLDLTQISKKNYTLQKYDIFKSKVDENGNSNLYIVISDIGDNYIVEKLTPKNINKYIIKEKDGKPYGVKRPKSQKITVEKLNKLLNTFSVDEIEELSDSIAKTFDLFVSDTFLKKGIKSLGISADELKSLTYDGRIKKIGVDNIFTFIKNTIAKIAKDNPNNKALVNNIEKVIDETNFNLLKEEAKGKIRCTSMAILENDSLDNTNQQKDPTTEEENVENYDEAALLEEIDEFDYGKKVGEKNIFNNLTTDVKLFLSSIPKVKSITIKTNPDGSQTESTNYDVNMIGLRKYVSLAQTYSQLLQINRGLLSSDEFLTEIRNKSVLPGMSFLKDIYQRLSNDSTMLSKVYSVTKNETCSHYEVHNDGTKNHLNVLNASNTTEDLLIETEDNILNNYNKYGLYNNDGTGNKENLQYVKEQFRQQTGLIGTNFALKALGFTTDVSIINNEDDIILLNQQINKLLNRIEKTDVLSNEDTIVNEFKDNYITIANILSKYLPQTIQDSYYFNGKLLYPTMFPSRLTQILTYLKRKGKGQPEVEDYIRKHYQQVKWFGYENGHYAMDWLNYDFNNADIGIVKYITTDSSYVDNNGKRRYNPRNKNSIEVDKATRNNLLSTIASLYYDPNGTKYLIPNLADSGNLVTIKQRSYEIGDEYTDYNRYERNLYDLFTTLAIQELDRIQRTYTEYGDEVTGEKGILEPKERVKNYDKNGKLFCFLTGLNNVEIGYGSKGKVQKFIPLNQIHRLKANPTRFYVKDPKTNNNILSFNNKENAIKFLVIQELDNLYQDYINKYNAETKANVNNHIFADNKIIPDAFSKEFFLNQMYAYNCATQLFVGDLAYYKATNGSTIQDYQKRFKGIFGRTQRLDVKPGQTIKTIYLTDESFVTEYKDAIYKYIDDIKSSGQITAVDTAMLKNFYEKAVDNTDGQGFINHRTLRDVLTQMGNSSQMLDDFFDAVEQHDVKKLLRSYGAYINPIKQFTQTNYIKPSHDGTSYESIPTQIKNSEALLLPLEMLGGPLQYSPKLRALYRIMNEQGIDKIQFVSAIKSGVVGAIDINNMNNENDIVDYITKQIQEDIFTADDINENSIVTEGQSRGNIVKEIDYTDFGIQTKTDSKHDIARQGTQMTKTLYANIRNNEIYILPFGNRIDENGNKKKGIKIRGKDLRTIYSTVLKLQKSNSYKNLQKRLSDKRINKTLRKNLKNSVFVDMDIINGFVENELGNTTLAINDPVIASQTLAIVSSIIRNEVTKQTIKGENLIQMSSYGVSDELKCVFIMDNGKEVSRDSFNKLNKEEKEQYDNWIDWAKEMYKNGRIKALKHIEVFTTCNNADIRDALTDKNTGKIDINKQVDGKDVMDQRLRDGICYRIPTEGNCSIFNYHIKDFLPNVYGSAIMIPAEFILITGSDFDIDKVFTANYEYYKTKDDGRFVKRNANLEQYFDVDNKKVTLDPDVNIDTALLNNMWVDIARTINSSPNTLNRILHPSSYPTISKLSKLNQILDNITAEEYKEFSGEFMKDEKLNIDKFLSLTDKQIDDYMEKYSKTIIPMTVDTTLDIHMNNNAAKELIGIYAVATALHNTLMSTETKVSDLNKISINGYRGGGTITEDATFTKKYDRNYRLISFNQSEFQASSVDNGKDPQLNHLCQNRLTAPMTNVLMLSGYAIEDVSLFFKQPAIQDVLQYYDEEIEKGTKFPNVDEIINRARQKYNLNVTSLNDLTTTDMMRCIVASNRRNKNNSLNEESTSLYNNVQMLSLDYFKTLYDISQDLRNISMFLRSDGMSGGISSNSNKIMKYILQLKDILNNSIHIKGFNTKKDTFSTKDTIGYINACRKYGIDLPLEEYVFKIFPEMKEMLSIAERLFEGIQPNMIGDKAFNSLKENYIRFAYSGYDYFNADNLKKVHSERFLNRFEHLRTLYPDLFKDNTLLKYLKVRKVKSNYRTLQFVMPNKNDSNLNKKVKNDWTKLLYHESKDINNLALELMIYSFADSAFQYKYGGFHQYIPTTVKKALPGYLNYTANKYGHVFNEQTIDDFITSYVTNYNEDIQFYKLDDSDVTFVANTNRGIFTIKGEKQKLPEFIQIKKDIYQRNVTDDGTSYVKIATKKSYDQIENQVPQYKLKDKVNTNDIYEVFFGETFSVSDKAKQLVEELNLC